MSRFIIFATILLGLLSFKTQQNRFISRQGQVTFFSYTTVENIQASNNTTYSIIDTDNNKIAVSILMKAFTFEKPLMQSHFNESYIESDLYPKATFLGEIINYDPEYEGIQTRIIKGEFTMRGVTKPIELKAQISRSNSEITVNGETNLKVKDYMINIPPILRPNISDNIKVSFNLVHRPHEK